jgi:hypothetical protein
MILQDGARLFTFQPETIFLPSTTLLEKYPTFFIYFFQKNLVNFNEANLHEATLKPQMYT